METKLTINVPIKGNESFVIDLDTSSLPLPSLSNAALDKLYLKNGSYNRKLFDTVNNDYYWETVRTYEFPAPTLGIDIIDFEYSVQRMGKAPTITATFNSYDNFEDLWGTDMYVEFNGEKFFLIEKPNFSKENTDARYKYSAMFVSERVVLENVYFYDAIMPYYQNKPLSESSVFSFFGDIYELRKKINASLIISELATIEYAVSNYLTYDEWVSVGMGTYSGNKDTSSQGNVSYYTRFHGDYGAYLYNIAYEIDPLTNEPILHGWHVEIGSDEHGNPMKSDEILLVFENNTIFDALQKIKDDFGICYYITKDPNTGDFLIIIGDHEYEFSSSAPFAYGRNKELLSFEKTKEDSKIVTKCTGYGSEDNIPWYYPNPTADGWLVPVYKRGDIVITSTTIDYPASEGSTNNEHKRYELYLKNRLGKNFVYGKLINTITQYLFLNTSQFSNNNYDLTLNYKLELSEECWVTFEFNNYFDPTNTNLKVSVMKDFGTTMNQREYEIFMPSNNAGTYFTYAYRAIGFHTYTGGNFLRSGTYSLSFLLQLSSLPYLVSPESILYVNNRNADAGYKTTAFYYPAKEFTFTFEKTCPEAYDVAMATTSTIASITAGLSLIFLSTSDYLSELVDPQLVYYPCFFSSIPNLAFSDGNGDAREAGWYLGATKIDFDDPRIEMPQANKTYYSYFHTTRSVDVNNGDYRKIIFYSEQKRSVYKLPSDDWDLDAQNWNVIYNYFHHGGNHTFLAPHTMETVVITKVGSFLDNGLFDLDIKVYKKGWTLNNNIVQLANYGIDNEAALTLIAQGLDEICFRRVKWLTPFKNLMPELWYRSEETRRFYVAKNYYLTNGSNDTEYGESLDTSYTPNRTNNEIYHDPDSQDASNNYHYKFKNLNNPSFPLEHIQEFPDVKPTITEMYNFVLLKSKPSDWDTVTTSGTGYQNYYIEDPNNAGEFIHVPASGFNPPSFPAYNTTYYAKERIDIIEEFAYDELDDNTTWEQNDGSGNTAGEYKHPHFFAKLRPLGFNLFDLALEGGGDMELSLTTGNCGACVFKIKVDEKTKKNPVQIWEYDVYRKSGGAVVGANGVNVPESYTKVYDKGTLRRYASEINLYYLTSGAHGTSSAVYTPVNSYGSLTTPSATVDVYNRDSDISPHAYWLTRTENDGFTAAIYTTAAVVNGEVGCLNTENKYHIAGDVKTSGKFNESQQDTTDNYVWVALEKDINTYGVLMPFAQRNDAGYAYEKYIRPLSIADVHVPSAQGQTESTIAKDEELADKFVITNIRLPQYYIRQAEHKLSVEIVRYMYLHNVRNFNFSINFSRIYYAQNLVAMANMNENSVLYIDYDGDENTRQYVSQFTYTKKADEMLPQVKVSLASDLTNVESQNKKKQRQLLEKMRNTIAAQNKDLNSVVHKTYDDSVINIVQ